MSTPRPRVLRRLRERLSGVTWTHAVAVGIVLVLFVAALAVSIEAAHMATGGE